MAQRKFAVRHRRIGLAALILALASLCISAAGQAGRFDLTLDRFNALQPFAAMTAFIALLLALVGARRSTTIVVALLTIASAAERMLPEWTRDIGRGASAPSGTRLRLVTYNVWRGNRDAPALVDRIMAERPDIVLLQEAGGTFGPMLPELAGRMGHRGKMCDSKRCDLVILSRWPTEEVQFRFRDATGGQFGPGLIQTRVTPPGGEPFTVATVHLDRKSALAGQARALGEAIQHIGDSAMIVAGDFNLTPWSLTLQRLDAAANPLRRVDRAQATYPDQLSGVPMPRILPIDHVYAGPLWQSHGVRTLPGGGSDHAGLFAILERR